MPRPAFKCAVTLKLLKDPLRSPLGHVFEREVIETWFRDFGNRCPLTGEPLSLAQLVPDEQLKSEIKDWKRGSRKSADNDDSNNHREETDEKASSKPLATTTATAASAAAVVVTTADDPYDF